MGFLDKVKEQASVAAAAAKDAAQKGQAKVDEVQAKRAADGILRQLGLAIYLEQTGRTSSTSESDVAKLIEDLKSYETEYGSLGADGDKAS